MVCEHRSFFDTRLAQGLADGLRAMGRDSWPGVWATLSPLLNPSERLTLNVKIG